MIRAFLLSVGQLGDRAFLGVFAKSMAATIALFAAGGVGLWWVLDQEIGDVSGLATVVALFLTALAMWLLFRVVAIGVLGLFADDVVAAVERRYYPDAARRARPVSPARAAAMGLRSAARVVLVNLIALPVYLLLLVTGIGTAVAFLVVNGWLLGRDLSDMVAARHLDATAMRSRRRTKRTRGFATGLVTTGLFVVPIVALVAPILGAAMATHGFHGEQA